MRKLAASLLASLPLLAAAQDSAQGPAQPASPQYTPPPQQAQPAPQYPPDYAPPPQYTPPPPQGQAAPPPQYPPPPTQYPPAPRQPNRPRSRQRDSWYIGFGLGGGDGRAHFTDGTVDFRDMVFSGADTLSFNFRVGATLTPRLLLGFDGGTVASFAEEAGLSSSVQANYYDVGIMYFPMERGPFLRAATGLSVFTQDIESLGSASARGLNVLGGVGYAFWLGRAFNLTLNLDLQRHWFNDPELEGATTWALWVGFDWY